MVFAAVRIFLVYFQVMKDWSDLEEKYQEMREKDPSSAEDFKKKMTERFQKTVQALEEESQAEKRQLQAMHQQRVISMINQKKKMAMACYTKALNENTPNTHRVQKCLQKLLRALHKDRHHTIQHFRHLLETSLDQVSGFLIILFKWLNLVTSLRRHSNIKKRYLHQIHLTFCKIRRLHSVCLT